MKKEHTYQYVGVNSTLSFILAAFKNFKFYVIWLFVTSTIWSIDVSLGPYLLKIMVDRAENIVHSSVLPVLGEPVLLYILLLIIVFIASRLDDFIWLKLKPNLQKYIGIKLMKRMMNHSADLYQNHFAGSLVNKINDVIGGIPDILRICVHQLFGNILTLIIASYTLYQTNVKFAAVFIFWGGVFIAISSKLSATASNLSKDVADIRSRLVGYKADTLSNITTIRLFTGKKYETQGLITAFDKLVFAMQKRDWFFLKMSTFQGGSFVLYQIMDRC